MGRRGERQRRAGHLEHIFSEGQRGVHVQQPAQEQLHADHVGRREGVVLRAGTQEVRDQQGGREQEQHEAQAVPEGVVLLLQPDGFVALQAQAWDLVGDRGQGWANRMGRTSGGRRKVQVVSNAGGNFVEAGQFGNPASGWLHCAVADHDNH